MKQTVTQCASLVRGVNSNLITLSRLYAIGAINMEYGLFMKEISHSNVIIAWLQHGLKSHKVNDPEETKPLNCHL